MTKYEFVKINYSMMQEMKKNNISCSDSSFVEMYEEYSRLKGEGHKITYIIQYLSDRFGVGKTHLYEIVKKMGENIEL